MTGKNWNRAKRKRSKGTGRPADVRMVRIERGLFEHLVRNAIAYQHGAAAARTTVVEWGERDDEGAYTPAIIWRTERPLSWWQRLLGLR